MSSTTVYSAALSCETRWIKFFLSQLFHFWNFNFDNLLYFKQVYCAFLRVTRLEVFLGVFRQSLQSIRRSFCIQAGLAQTCDSRRDGNGLIFVPPVSSSVSSSGLIMADSGRLNLRSIFFNTLLGFSEPCWC